jgi:hypothetical protein
LVDIKSFLGQAKLLHRVVASEILRSALFIAHSMVEVLIAVSIFVSAAHAWRPIFPGKEAWIAAFFGLIHGLAFAATLDRLGLEHWDRVAGILAFNLGIEAMQMLVVVALLPSLMLMSRTRVYPILRLAGAGFAALASAGWIAERLSIFLYRKNLQESDGEMPLFPYIVRHAGPKTS